MKKSGRFLDQKVVVTGGGTGIGKAITLAFASEGAMVRIVGPNEEPLKEVKSHFPDQIEFMLGDVRKVKTWDSVISTDYPVDVLVNNAAISLQSDPIGRETEAWSKIMEVNFRGTLYGCQKAALQMGNRGGRIINISSILGRICEKGSTAYGVAKAAVDQLTRYLAVELAAQKILVNAIAPGFVDTPMSRAQGVNELETDWFRINFIENGRLPLKRAGQPEEIARAALFLAEKENTYMTGQVLTVDGGLTLTF